MASRRAAIGFAVAIACQLGAPSKVLAQSTMLNDEPTHRCENLVENRPVKLALANVRKMQPSAGSIRDAKGSAILGALPSKLEQMRASQGATQPLAQRLSVAALPPSMLSQPVDCIENGFGRNGFTSPTDLGTFQDTFLGTRSVSVTRTPFDQDWAALRTRPKNAKIQSAIALSGARHTSGKYQQVDIVNRWVNRNIAYGEDSAVYRRADYWAPAQETLRRGIGDCEDFAIAKMEILSALGVAREDMRLIIARDLVRNSDHAVLIVTLESGTVMLDNATDRLLDGRLPNDYRPIMSFSRNAKWVHGYSVEQNQPTRMASNPVATSFAAKVPYDVVTVTVEPELPALSVALLSVPSALPTLLSELA